jgi:hypothetical protein
MMGYLAVPPSARSILTGSPILVATTRLVHVLQHCRRPFVCAICSSLLNGALVALGSSSFRSH